MQTLHPDMPAIQEAQKLAYTGTTIAEQRAAWSAYTAALAAPRAAGLSVEDRVLTTLGHAVPVRIYRPAGASEAASCILYMHGGGFMKGDLDSSDPVAWGFSHQTGAVVVSIDYRLTPEHPFPAAFDDCRHVLAHVAEHAGAFGVDVRRIALAGDSAGAHLAASLALAAREMGGPATAAQALVYPCLGSDLSLPSFRENATGFGLTTSAMGAYMEMLLPRGWRSETSPLARPFLAADLTGLPPTMVHTAGLDPLRDEGRAFAARLAQAGTDVVYREARGMIHGFMRARFTGVGARAEYAAICEFLRDRLKS